MSRPVSHSNTLLRRLIERSENGIPVTVAIVGAGEYALGLLSQLRRIHGTVAPVLCDLDAEVARRCVERSGGDASRWSLAGSPREVAGAIEGGQPVITTNADDLASSGVEVVVECTGDPETGTRVARRAIEAGSHVVMVNVEADATAGAELAALARRAGTVYTLADGDQPSLIVGLADWSQAIGFDLVAAGKWTDAYSRDEAARLLARRSRPSRSDVTFLDGSKAQIELASAANCLGLSVHPQGTVGPALSLERIPECFRSNGPDALFAEDGVCDYIDCTRLDPETDRFHGGGVFVCVRGDARAAMDTMARKGVVVSADHTHALFYRPYHLVGAETTWTVLLAAIEGRPTAQPLEGRTVEVVAVAKRPIRAGEVLAGLGGDDVAGRALPALRARAEGLLPCGLASGATARSDIPEGALLTTGSVEPPADSECWRLRAESLRSGHQP